MGYSVPDASPARLRISLPDSSQLGSSRNASSTRRVWREIRTPWSTLPIVESLHRVRTKSKATRYREHGKRRSLSASDALLDLIRVTTFAGLSISGPSEINGRQGGVPL